MDLLSVSALRTMPQRYTGEQAWMLPLKSSQPAQGAPGRQGLGLVYLRLNSLSSGPYTLLVLCWHLLNEYA